MRAQSHIFNIMRGSIAGVTYFANQFHQIVARARTAPVDPSTDPQQDIRASMSYASQLYDALSDANKLLWDQYADTVNYSGPFGNYTIPGRQMCIGCVSVPYYLGQQGISIGVADATPPTTSGKLGLTGIGYQAPTSVGTGVEVVFTNPNTETCIIYAEISGKQTASRFRYKGPFDSSTLDSDSVATTASGSIEFLGLDDGGIYFVRLRAVTNANPFRLSNETIIRCVAAETTV